MNKIRVVVVNKKSKLAETCKQKKIYEIMLWKMKIILIGDMVLTLSLVRMKIII